MTNVVNLAYLDKANHTKPILNFKKVKQVILSRADQIISELPNTHQCSLCSKQVPMGTYLTRNGMRYCSEVCLDVAIERNPVERYEDETNQMED